MGTTSAAVSLLWLLTLAAVLPSQQADSGDSAATAASVHQLAASEQLSQLLEQAVQRVLGRRQAADDSGQLERLQHRLDVLELRLTTLTTGQCEARQPPADSTCRDNQTKTKSGTGPEPEPASGTEPTESREPRRELQLPPEPEPEPCEKSPSPLPTDQAPHRQPAVLACARSCLQLRDQGGSPQDGVYWFTGMLVPTLCDFSHDGGGWTLLLTAKVRDGWNLLSVRGRKEHSPSLDDNYSILRHADAVRDLGSGDRFAYRIETQAEKSRQRWGGIWIAPRSYSFMAETPDQTEVICVRKFDKWAYKSDGIKKRMPWLNIQTADAGSSHLVLTTSTPSIGGWGSLLYDEGYAGYQHSPWSNKDATHSGKVLYWMREELM